MLEFLNNYGPYAKFIERQEPIVFRTSDLNINTWLSYFNSALNILRDGIETDYVQTVPITVIFDTTKDSEEIELFFPDFIINLLFWRPIVNITTLTPKYIVFEPALTKSAIKDYIDDNIIDPLRVSISNKRINNIIDNMLSGFKFINIFAMYLGNTINLEDDVNLMIKYPRVREIFNCSMAGIPIEEVKDETMKLTHELIGYIMKEKSHCLSDAFTAREGIKDKQYKEYSVNIGPKPDGRGGIFPAIIDSNFTNGGLKSLSDIFIESSVGRTAQILQKNNVGDSGHFARLLRLNNSDTFLHKDPNYICGTRNFEEVLITGRNMLNRFKHRYYRTTLTSIEYKINPKTDTHLIGKVIYLRSPITCASRSNDQGICYRCYGDLAHTNSDINIGIMAAQIISAILTQILLSAKHLLEAKVDNKEWSSKFNEYFNVSTNVISATDPVGSSLNGVKLIIPADDITQENEHDDFDFNDYIKSFMIFDGEVNHTISSYSAKNKKEDRIYITKDFMDIISSAKPNEEDNYVFDLEKLSNDNIQLFVIKIMNDELSKTLEDLMDTINMIGAIKGVNRDQILQKFLEISIEGGLAIDAVHCECIIANQIRNSSSEYEAILELPDWEVPNAPYQILTLDQALTNNPSIVVSLDYQKIAKAIFSPTSYKKSKASVMDPFFVEQPVKFMKPSNIGVKQ